MQKNNPAIPTEKYCHFCVNGITEIDYKNSQMLQRFLSSYGKIAPRKRSGVCAKHQRQLATAVKQARFMALLPYTTK
jgi:small subunit ribosomal protein S18